MSEKKDVYERCLLRTNFANLHDNQEEAATEKENPITDFKYVTLDDGTLNVAYIGNDTEVVFPSEINGVKVTAIGGITGFNHIEIREKLKSVTIPDTVTVIDINAFEDCTSLTEVNLSDSLVEIRSNAFRNCSALLGIDFPDSLINIGEYAFYNCTSLKSIILPANLETCDAAFLYSGVEKIELKEGLESIPYFALSGTKIKEITLPSTIKEISQGAFSKCTLLEKVILNEGLNIIDTYAFSYCESLNEMVIPESVNKLNETAFYQCNDLKKVMFEGNAPGYFSGENLYEGYESEMPPYIVFYHEGAQGFTSPEWNGYKTEIW